MEWIIGMGGSLLVAGAAYAKRSLSGSGLAAAVVVGTVMYALGSAVWFGTLLAFFISSTLLSKWRKKAKLKAESGYEKTDRRDAGQVAANGGVAALLCAANAIWPDPLWWFAFLGVMAAVNADTWATEIGGLSKRKPRSILTGRPVPAGTSGGVSALGLLASMAGGLFIGVSAWILLQAVPGQTIPDAAPGSSAEGGNLLRLLIWAGVAWIGGTAGSLTDSVLGATWQRMYRCTICGREIEQRVHCGRETAPIRGYAGWNNDAVNMACSLTGGLFAIGAALLLKLV